MAPSWDPKGECDVNCTVLAPLCSPSAPRAQELTKGGSADLLIAKLRLQCDEGSGVLDMMAKLNYFTFGVLVML